MPPTCASLAHAIPEDARQRLAALAPTGLQALAFTPTGGWVIVATPTAEHAGYAARGIPDACFVKLGEFVRAGHAVRSIAFAPGERGGWAIVSDQGYAASGIANACFDAIATLWAQGSPPSCVAFTPDGAGWLVLAGREVRSHGIATGLRQRLNNAAQGLRPAQQVAFTPAGGWVMLAQDRFAAQRIATACSDHLAQVAQAHEVQHIAFTPNGGWWVSSNTLRTARPADPLRELEDRFRLVNGRWRRLDERMAVQHVAGVSIAVSVDGAAAAWAEHGEIDVARLALRLVEHGRFGFAIGTQGGAEAALADEIEEALLRVYRDEAARRIVSDDTLAPADPAAA